MTPTGVTKQGNRDPASAWAICRKGWVIQLMLMLGVDFADLTHLEIKDGPQPFLMHGSTCKKLQQHMALSCPSSAAATAGGQRPRARMWASLQIGVA